MIGESCGNAAAASVVDSQEGRVLSGQEVSKFGAEVTLDADWLPGCFFSVL